MQAWPALKPLPQTRRRAVTVEIGIVEDDRRVLAPQFQGDGREVGCSTSKTFAPMRPPPVKKM